MFCYLCARKVRGHNEDGALALYRLTLKNTKQIYCVESDEIVLLILNVILILLRVGDKFCQPVRL